MPEENRAPVPAGMAERVPDKRPEPNSYRLALRTEDLYQAAVNACRVTLVRTPPETARAAIAVAKHVRESWRNPATRPKMALDTYREVERLYDTLEERLTAEIHRCAGAVVRDLKDTETARLGRVHVAHLDHGRTGKDADGSAIVQILLLRAVERVIHAQHGWAHFYPALRPRPKRETPAETANLLEEILTEVGRPLDPYYLERLSERPAPAVARALGRDPRFRRIAKSRWGLTDWGLAEYTTIANALDRLIEAASGSILLRTAAHTIARHHNVHGDSVIQAARYNGFAIDEDGTVRPRARPKGPPEGKEPMTGPSIRDVRLAIFRKPRRGRYKIYVVGRRRAANGGVTVRERRIAANGQPFHGFKTLDEARTALATLDLKAEASYLLAATGGTPIPPEEQEIDPGVQATAQA